MSLVEVAVETLLKGGGVIQATVYVVEEPEEPDLFIDECILEQINSRLYVLLLVIAVALVAVIMWLWLTGKFCQVNISTALTTIIPTISRPILQIKQKYTRGPTFKIYQAPHS